MQKKRVELLPHQWKFMRSEKRFAALIGGVGSGKSHIGSLYIIKRVMEYPKALHFIGANTYAQLRDATLKTMFRNLEAMDIKYMFNQTAGLLEFCNGTVLCKSMENYDAIRGIEIATFLLDEARDTKREAFDMMMGRLRDSNAKTLEGRLTTSPAGYNWIYDYFHKDGEKNNDQFEIINATSYDNIFLPDGYLDSIKSMYSDSFYEQEILGQFVRGGRGSVFPWILTAKHPTFDEVKPKDLNKWVVHVGMDPASTSIFGVVFFLFNPYTKKIIVFDEIYEKEMSKMTAREMHKSIKEKLSQFFDKNSGYKLVADIEFTYDEASAWWKNEVSEIEPNWWMRQSEKSKFGVDGYIALVRQCMSMNLITITKNCVDLIKELEGYVRKDNGTIPKENDHCIEENQLIYTKRGQVSIKDVTTDDYVLTRIGYKKVLSNIDKGVQKTIEIVTCDKSLICTEDHLIWSNYGWTEAINLKHGDKILCAKKQSSLMGYHFQFIQMESLRTLRDITRAVLSFGEKESKDTYIDTFGLKIMAIFQKIFTFTTKMKTLIITTSQILNAYTRMIILLHIRMLNLLTVHLLNNSNILITLGQWARLGIQVKKARLGILSMEKMYLEILSQSNYHAFIAGKNIKQNNHLVQNSAISTVKALIVASLGLIMLIAIAPFVAISSLLTRLTPQKHVQEIVQINLDIERKVRDLSIEDCLEFYASDILVHNCINALQYSIGSLGLDFNEVPELKPIEKEPRRAFTIEEEITVQHEYGEFD